MSYLWPTRALVAASALIALGAVAQTAPAPATASNPSASPPAPAGVVQPYQSALQGYRSLEQGDMVPWQQANDTVGRIGGWRAYAREAQAAPGAAEAPAGAAAGAADPHAGHGKR